MSAGRPSKYNDALLKKARNYLVNYEVEGDVLPQIAGLAIYLGISRETVYAWAADPDKSEFADIVTQVMAAQERKLVNRGLTGDFNATITRLALAKHGYAERTDNTHDVRMSHEDWIGAMKDANAGQ